MPFDTASIDVAISEAMEKLGFQTLKPKQREAIMSFMLKDTFVSLPTGYGHLCHVTIYYLTN